jgi:HKD family nuclease
LDQGFDVKIAVAFLKSGGLNPLLSRFKGTKGQFVVGASNFCITDWKALDDLWTVSRRNPNLGVRINTNTAFHPKVFYFEKGPKAEVILGSSNLTAGGLGDNVEANVLVQGNPTDQFFSEVKNLVQVSYRDADQLSRDFLAYYRRQSSVLRKFRRKEGGRTWRPTPLPHSRTPETKKMPKSIGTNAELWKVAPGFDGQDWPRWENSIDSTNSGFAAIGWSKVGDLTRSLNRTWSEFSRSVVPKIRENYESEPAYAARQLWTFGKIIRTHDLIVAYSNRTVFGIAEVTGDYYFQNDSQEYRHARPVRWLTLDRNNPPTSVMHKIATNNTVSLIHRQEVVAYLKQKVLGIAAVETANHNTRHMAKKKTYHTIGSHFRGKRSVMRPTYLAFAKEAKALGNDVVVYAMKRFIGFRRRPQHKRFASIHVLDDRLQVALILARTEIDPRLIPASDIGWARGRQPFTNVIELSEIRDLDTKLARWLAISYSKSR